MPYVQLTSSHTQHNQLEDDYDDLYCLLGDAVCDFMKLKPQPFTNSLLSKKDFWVIPQWKRAMIFVFLSRYVMEKNSQKMWQRFTYEDYKHNWRSFKRWCVYEDKIMNRSKVFSELPEDCESSNRKRIYNLIHVATSSAESPMKRRIKLNDDTTDSDDDNININI